MDLGPRRVMRAIQLGLKDQALSSTTIWLCVFCQTCSARCPREIFIAQVIGSVDLVTILKPVEMKARLIIMAADMMKARMAEGMFTFSLAPKC